MIDDLAEPVLLELADRGAGFRFAPDLPADLLRQFRPLVEHLLTATTPQPPVHTAHHRLWSLQMVDTPGSEDRFWCFSVQGRGGPFGAAGTCQFAFASARRWHPGQLWLWCTTRMDQGTLAVNAVPAEQYLPPIDDDGRLVAARLVRHLVAGSSRIGLGHSPAVAATVLTRLLPALPPAVVARYLWSTGLLRKPLSAAQAVVAAAWPDDLRRQMPGPADGVDVWLDDDSRQVAKPVPIDETRARALDWFVGDIAAAAPEYHPRPGVGSLPELLDLVADAYLPMTVADVEKLLRTEAGIERLARSPDVLTQWAKQCPDQARAVLMMASAPELDEALFAGLWRLLDREQNPLGIPRPDEPEPVAGWHRRLAELLRASIPAVELPERMTWFLGAGRPLGSEEALVAAAPWLRSLGLDRRTHRPFFPVPLARMGHHLAAVGGLSVDDREELLTLDRSPLPELVRLVQNAVDARAAAALIGVLGEHWGERAEPAAAEIEELTTTLVRARVEHGGPTDSEWLDRLLDGVESLVAHPGPVRGVVYTAVGVLAADPSFVLSAPVKDRCRAVLARDPALDPVYRFLMLPEPAPAQRDVPDPDKEPTAGADLDDAPADHGPRYAVQPSERGAPPLTETEPPPTTVAASPTEKFTRPRWLADALVAVALLLLCVVAVLVVAWSR